MKNSIINLTNVIFSKKFAPPPRYCNSRVAVFDKEGNFVTSFGDGEFEIPHSLALAEDLDIIAVADRENEL